MKGDVTMEWQGIALLCGFPILATIVLWLCVNRIIWEFERPGKAFFTWLRRK